MFVIDYPDGVCGPNVWLTRHLPELKRLGFAPEVLVASRQQRQACRYADALERAGIPVTRITIQGAHTEAAVSAMLSAVAADPPDVFVPNCSAEAHVAARFLRDAGVVTLTVMHSDDPYYHDLFGLFVAGRPEWRVSAVVSVSEALREMATARQPDRPVPLLHAPYGVPTPSAVAGWRPDRFRAIYVGRLVEYQKRVARTTAHFVAAAQVVPRFEAVLYGDGGAQGDVARIIASAACDDRVRLGGTLHHGAIQATMAGAQVFVLLSDFEGLSIALMEAMATGLVPIVSRTRSGATDLVRHGETGFIIDADDREAFILICRRLSEDRALWESLSRAARATVAEHGYTSAGCAARWADFLHGLVPAERQASPLSIPSDAELTTRRVWPTPDSITGIHYGSAIDRCWLRRISAAGRPLFLWGAGAAGERFLEMLDDASVPIAGFIDSDVRKHGSTLRDLPITPPATLDRHAADTSTPRSFVVVTSMQAREIAEALDARGFQACSDYLIW